MNQTRVVLNPQDRPGPGPGSDEEVWRLPPPLREQEQDQLLGGGGVLQVGGQVNHSPEGQHTRSHEPPGIPERPANTSVIWGPTGPTEPARTLLDPPGPTRWARATTLVPFHQPL